LRKKPEENLSSELKIPIASVISENAEQELMDGLHWLGIDWDEDLTNRVNSVLIDNRERKEIYLKYAEQLIKQGGRFLLFLHSRAFTSEKEEQEKRKEFPSL
jgi:glutamyl/glutaminyl-tRNA synthetase